MLKRFVADDSAQDLIEYALLTACIGLVGVAVWNNIRIGIGNAYAGWDTGVQDISACTPDPQSAGGGGCP